MIRFLLAALVVSWLACSPGYQSGQTQCSDKGECPSGFICSEGVSGSAHTCVTRPNFCTDQYAFYCRASDTCWPSAVACSTVFNCGTSTSPDYRACMTAGLHPSCTDSTTCLPATGGEGGRNDAGAGGAGGSGGKADAGLQCTDPAYPVYCGSLGAVPAGCWSPGTVCSTVTNCGTSAAPSYAACSTPGYHPDCGGTNCVPDSTGVDGGNLRGDGSADGMLDVRTADALGCPTPAAGGTCNVFPACGCPAGKICYPDTQATGLVCLATAGLGEGAACNGKGCAAGLGCFGGVCKPYCQSDSDCPAVDTARECAPTYWDSTSTIAGVFVCVRVCDPVSPQSPRSPLLACPAGFGCSSAGTSYPGASNCVQQPGTGVSDSACSEDADCTPGYYCSVGGTCIKYCYTSVDCPTGMTCVSFSTANYAGTVQVNHCSSPK